MKNKETKTISVLAVALLLLVTSCGESTQEVVVQDTVKVDTLSLSINTDSIDGDVAAVDTVQL